MIRNYIGAIRRDLDTILLSFKRKGSFTRNLSYVVGGKVAIVILMFITAPILSRLYSPAEYGYFSFLNAIALNFSVFSALGYPLALIIVSDSRDFYNLLSLSFLLASATTVVASLCLLIFSDHFIPFSLGESNSEYLGLFVGSLFLYSATAIIQRWNVWKNQFRQGSSINVLVNAGSRMSSLGLGAIGGFPFGLVMGEMVGRLLGLIANLRVNFMKERRELFSLVSITDMRQALKKYSKYPRYVLTSTYLRTLLVQIPILMFPYFFNAEVAGNYSLSASLINMPSLLIALPLSSVFTKKAVELRSESESLVSSFVSRLYGGLTLVSILPFAFLSVWSEDLFTIVFGKNWILAGTFTSILAFSAVIDLIQVSMQGILLVYEKEQLLFRDTALNALLVVILFIPGVMLKDPIISLTGYTVGRLLGGILVVAQTLRATKNNWFRAILFLFLKFGLAYLAFFGAFMLFKFVR